MREIPSHPRSRRRLAGGILVLLVLGAAAMVAVPMLLIDPFSAQTPGGLAVAYTLRRWASLGTGIALVLGLGIAVWLWRGGRWWSRTALALALLVLAATTWGARKVQTIFEEWFQPVITTVTVPAAETDWLEEGDAVLAVAHNGDAAAYPVRQIAYHHIVHDVVGGLPVVATY